MTNIAQELDMRLRQLDTETARRLESLVRDALALAKPIAIGRPNASHRRWPIVPATGKPITKEEIEDASDDAE